ncbi:putative LRR containing protein [Trachipleistophora hominis]|uniref:Putative LRR containing protein n=1 Tax=Trachipleistophora hominis TaxID=72359 RepID=L7JYP7_TRAHO|nr:putative LRR containing protein [Trachipleistophora hominis]
MSVNLHSYIEIALKYILIFKTPAYAQMSDYMVFEDLEQTGMKSLLETYMLNTIAETSYDTSECNAEHHIKKMRLVSECANYNTIYVSKDFYGKNIIGKSYQDIIREEGDTKFKLINVPFSMAIFTKIYLLENKDDPVFTNEELCTVFFHIFPHVKRISKLTKAICFHLQNNPLFIQELHIIAYDLEEGNHGEEKKLLSTLLTCTSDQAKVFREMVNSMVTFSLRDKKKRVAKTNEKIARYGDIFYDIKLEELNIAFLLENLIMSYDYFVSNHGVLYEKFGNSLAKLSLSIKIRDIHDRNDDMKLDLFLETRILNHKINFITESRLLKDGNIHKISLQFDGVQIPLEKGALSDLKKLSTIVCDSTSFVFVESASKEIEKLEVSLKDKILGSTLCIPHNVKKISFSKSQFCRNITFPNHLDSIEIMNSKADQDVIIIFDESCENVTMENTQTKIKFLEFAALNYILLKCEESGCSDVHYRNDKNSENGYLRISNSELSGEFYLNEGFRKVIFVRVNLTFGSKVVFCGQNKSLKISGSTGLFDLKYLIGSCLSLTRNSEIEIRPIENSLQNFSILFIKNVEMSECLVLPDYFENVELENVSLTNNMKVLLNRTSKTIILKNFKGIIDFTDAVCLETAKIHFGNEQKNDIIFHGMINTHHLCLINVVVDLNAVQSILFSLGSVKHLKFEVTDVYNINIEECIRVLKSFPRHQERAVYFDNLRKNPLSYCTFSNSLFQETTNATINSIIEGLGCVPVSKTLQNIEFESAKFFENSYSVLRHLENLRILDLGTQYITDVLFNHLPPKIRLLNITGLNKQKGNGLIKYNLCELQKLTNFSNLKVLTINAELLLSSCTLVFMPLSVDVLKIHFDSEPSKHKTPLCVKRHLRELIIKKPGHWEDVREAQPFVDILQHYIDFRSLEQLIFVRSYSLVKVNPHTLELIEARSGEFFERVGSLRGELEIDGPLVN